MLRHVKPQTCPIAFCLLWFNSRRKWWTNISFFFYQAQCSFYLPVIPLSLHYTIASILKRFCFIAYRSEVPSFSVLIEINSFHRTKILRYPTACSIRSTGTPWQSERERKTCARQPANSSAIFTIYFAVLRMAINCNTCFALLAFQDKTHRNGTQEIEPSSSKVVVDDDGGWCSAATADVSDCFRAAGHVPPFPRKGKQFSHSSWYFVARSECFWFGGKMKVSLMFGRQGGLARDQRCVTDRWKALIGPVVFCFDLSGRLPWGHCCHWIGSAVIEWCFNWI